ncbi:HAD family hydrolase [Kineosporia sp. J2-2]|uniref:HAD family hydrolase n=1 Tax=Kineosporia corallincola TaxID=2835133 RepID=A0ABS5TJG9_9ACTN|nr:HAD family hydrolase [Kineosporia corallincola]MBT0771242.1 HAD family hydrolase [Kineosporia corallincola]
MFGAVVARGLDYRETFQHFRPDFDLAAERRKRIDAGDGETFAEGDLYPDARACLAALRELEVVVGIAGNQTARAEEILRALDLPMDVLGTSESWNAEKPSTAFFERLVQEANCEAGEILYVGDRLDNDLLPALEVGLEAAVIRRGPWAHIWADRPELARCLFQLDGLAELPSLVEKHNQQFA